MVGFRVVVADEVQFFRMGLAGVPDSVLVKVIAEPPSEHDGIELSLADKSLQQDGPLVDLHLHLDADLLEVILDEGGDIASNLVAVVGEQCEGEPLPILHADSVRTDLPACLI